MARLRPAIALLSATLLLTACSSSGDESADAAGESIVVTTSETPSAEPVAVDPVQAETLRGATVDPGLNVEWTLQGASSGPTGGSVITVLVKNLNDEPLPPDAIGQPTLKYNSGGGNMVDSDPMTAEQTEVTQGLDLPLGPGASANLRYSFQVTPGNLWDAELKVGNVIWDGRLNF